MPNFCFVTFLCFISFVVLGCDQVESLPEDLIPLRANQLWTYSMEEDSSYSTYSVSLHKGYFVSNVSDSIQFQFRRPTGHPFVGLGMKVILPNSDGTSLVTNYTGVCCPDEVGVAINHLKFKYPATVGEVYENVWSTIQGGGGSYMIEVSEEEIETTFGHFNALVYSTEERAWYFKPGLGMIRFVLFNSNGDVRYKSDLIDYESGF